MIHYLSTVVSLIPTEAQITLVVCVNMFVSVSKCVHLFPTCHHSVAAQRLTDCML